MRKILFLFAVLFIFHGTFASSRVVRPPLNASEIFINVGKTGQSISLLELSRIKVRDFEKLTGKSLKFFDRLTFKAAQRSMRNSINDDGSLNNRRIEKFVQKAGGEGGGFHGGGFALGLLLGLIGVLIAYLINDDKKRMRVKWAWIGWAIWVAIVLAFWVV